MKEARNCKMKRRGTPRPAFSMFWNRKRKEKHFSRHHQLHHDEWKRFSIKSNSGRRNKENICIQFNSIVSVFHCIFWRCAYLAHPEKKRRSFRHTFFFLCFFFFSIIFLRKMSFLPSCDKERVSHWSSPPMSFLMAPWRGSACSRESRALPRTRVSYGDKDAVRASFRGCHKNPFLALEYKWIGGLDVVVVLIAGCFFSLVVLSLST